MILQVYDGAIPLLPNILLVAQFLRKTLVAENLWVHANNEDFFIVGTIEDADPASFGKPTRRAPEKIMLQFFSARLFETENLTALRIDPGHNVPDGAVLACRVHRLKNNEQCVAIGRVVKLLQRAQFLNVLFQQLLIFFFRFEERFDDGRPLLKFDLVSMAHTEIL